MQVFSTSGQPLTRQKITPGNTAAGLARASYFTLGDRKVPFTSGGTHEVVVGDLLTGATSSAALRVTAIVLESGTWAGGNAAGWLYGVNQTGVFQAENLNEGANSNVCTIPSDSSKIHHNLQAKNCKVIVEDYALRCTKDGTTPTATAGTAIGDIIQAGQNFMIADINEIRNFKCIDAVSGEAGTAHCELYF